MLEDQGFERRAEDLAKFDDPPFISDLKLDADKWLVMHMCN